ncbi:PucR family transcriptional regulator ligand-binding domain-containing protein [Ruminococcaceae bacterium OttesenSCG-928-A11]|nr:PucR family transcriptional regulator ligand-binding domain-containing protein [Ruminococcaceae bacterium OttesenSCG-928-A11]
MGVTVADLLKLPSLRDSRVLGGAAGLSKAVSSISVLEYTDDIQLRPFSAESFGNEVLISAMSYCRDDVDEQCAAFRGMQLYGGSALILFYVGIVVKRVDQRLIDLADETGTPLIVMPENRGDLRYSEVIYEVMEVIFKNQRNYIDFQTEILDRMARLPAHQRSIDTVLRFLSDRFHACMLLADENNALLSACFWPKNFDFNFEETLLPLAQTGAEGKLLIKGELFYLHTQRVQANGRQLTLFALHRSENLLPETVAQMGEVIRINIKLWDQGFGETGVSELLRAIVQDKPYNTARLATMMNVDLDTLDSVWMVTPKDGEQRYAALQMLPLVRAELEHQFSPLIAGVYEDSVVALTRHRGDAAPFAGQLVEQLAEARLNATVTIAAPLHSLQAAREAILLNREAITAARAIFPEKQVFSQAEVQFAAQCRHQLDQNMSAVRAQLALLESLAQDENFSKQDMIHTMSVYLLDCDGSVVATAARLFLHKNTVLYRLKRLRETLGYSIDKMPERIELYKALALRRLLAFETQHAGLPHHGG